MQNFSSKTKLICFPVFGKKERERTDRRFLHPKRSDQYIDLIPKFSKAKSK